MSPLGSAIPSRSLPDALRVLHVFGTMNRGGAEMRTVQVMQELAPSGEFTLHYCVLSGKAGDLDPEIRRLGGEVHRVPLRLGFASHFRRLLLVGAFDVVHSHVHYSSGLILRLAGRVGVPRRIAHWRTTADGRGRGPRRRVQRALLRRWIDEYATDILAVGEAAMVSAWRPDWHADARCMVVPSGVPPTESLDVIGKRELRAELAIEPSDPVVLHVGRADAAKNHRRLLSIFRLVHQICPRAVLLLAGRSDTAIATELKALCDRWGLSHAVRWLGVREDVPNLLQISDVMLFPSLWEGVPGAVLEACAAGLPVIGSDIPGIREVAAHCQGVQCLNLGSSDDCWAAAVISAAARSGDERDRARNAFSRTPYTLAASSQAHAAIWRGAARRTIPALVGVAAGQYSASSAGLRGESRDA